jgi:peptidoglycan/LPS O-acetylase OafA/YrhL
MLLVSIDNKHSHYLSPKYRPDIDGLRALAVLSVVGFHAFPELVKGGYIGVDIFFVISGFLISSLIVKNLELDNFSFTEFYSRRIRRIFPALLLVLFSCAIAGWYFISDAEYARLGKDLTGGAGFVSNFVLWSESGYFDRASDSKPLLHLWSLGIEEQFYIFWPLMVWLGWKQKWNSASIAIPILLLSFAINVAFIQTYPVATFYSPVTRIWELLLGAVLVPVADRKMDPDRIGKYLEIGLGILGIAAVAVAVVALDRDKNYPGWWALLPTMGAALIIYAGPRSWVNKWLLSNPLMIWFGLISYPLYLWHWPLLSFLRITGALNNPNEIGAAAVVTSVGLAWLTYRFVEKPIRSNGRENPARSSTRRGMAIDLRVAVLVSAMVILFVAGNTIYLTDGKVYAHDNKIAALPPLPDQRVFNELKIFEHWMRPDTSCRDKLNWGELLPEEVCVANSSRPRVLFIGDSHAMALYSSIFAGQIDIPSALVASPGCLFYPNLAYKPKSNEWGRNCTQISQKALTLARNLGSIDTIIVANIRKENAADKLTQFYSGDTPLTDHDAFMSGTQYLVSSLLALGKRVIYVVDVPYFPNTPENCQTRFLVTKSDDCVINKSESDKSFGQYFETIKTIKRMFPKLEIFDAEKIICADGKCSQHDASQYFYIDKDHLSVYGSEKELHELSKQFSLLN